MTFNSARWLLYHIFRECFCWFPSYSVIEEMHSEKGKKEKIHCKWLCRMATITVDCHV